MSKYTPWDDIQTPKSDYNVRHIPNSYPIEAFWGKNSAGKCLFILELDGDHSDYFRANTTSIKGLSIDLRQDREENKQRLVITLEQRVDADLFQSLCSTLVSSLEPVSASAEALVIALTHIKRWKVFFAGQRRNLLTAEEVRGLFAELHFLRLLYQGRFTQDSAMEAWCGPAGSHQDFIYENTAVEIKSLSGHERNSVRISSEDQLETQCDSLFLVTFKLVSSTSNGQSLNDLIKLIYDELSESSAIETFSLKLIAAGYVELQEYNSPSLQVVEIQPYQLTEEFPRLIRSSLPNGIIRVSYEIKLESITAFKSEIGRVI
ncbi:PD-(D/E)XK motif protein [Desulfoplanes sp. PS50]